jgi:hypothetical protein
MMRNPAPEGAAGITKTAYAASLCVTQVPIRAHLAKRSLAQVGLRLGSPTTHGRGSRRSLCGIALSLVLLLVAAGCAPGNDGSQSIGFLRGDELWSMQPDGSALLQLTSPPTIGFAWSPDHHEFVARYAGSASNPLADPVTGSTGDVFSGLGITSVDGGAVLPITPSQTPLRSDAWWDASGNRLIYREDFGSDQQWILSQPDQPAGIARKAIAAGIPIPTTNADASQVATIAANGDLVVGAPQSAGRAIQHNVIAAIATASAVWPLRLEWRPLHGDILYATAASGASAVTLMVTDLTGHATPVATVPDLEDYSWSPDGSLILIRTALGFQIVTASGAQVLAWQEVDTAAVAWWSPDSHYVMMQDLTSLKLARVASRDVKTLAMWPLIYAPVTLPKSASAWHVVPGSPWSATGDRFALVAPGGVWQGGAQLATGKGQGTGVYIISAGNLSSAAPHLIDWGQHIALSWSTPDPNTQLVTP